MLPLQKQNTWDILLNTIQESYAIQTHWAFYNWLKAHVHPLMRHAALLTAWGDFSHGQLKFDVCADMPEFSTQTLLQDSAIVNYLMCNLYKHWVDHDERWFVIDQFDASDIYQQSPNPFTQHLNKMHSLLVYGVRDSREKTACLYVFMDHRREFDTPDHILGMLMPHLDAALRRVAYLEPPAKAQELHDSLPTGGLSDREQEILHWVRSGKTNFEIGMILNISPNTVKNHLKRIFQKLDVSCRAQAVAKTGMEGWHSN
ncbi:MAG TPA: XrtB/PEP-CTERM-associated transcriptional regulator EpsA [Methylophilus sp.]